MNRKPPVLSLGLDDPFRQVLHERDIFPGSGYLAVFGQGDQGQPVAPQFDDVIVNQDGGFLFIDEKGAILRTRYFRPCCALVRIPGSRVSS